MSEYVDLLTTLAECEKARYAAEAAAEEARQALRAIQRETTYPAAFAITVRYFAAQEEETP